jgi:glycosyltransferase involved in cell wall biosynthesis
VRRILCRHYPKLKLKQMPAISVIIPAYHVAPYIGDTLDSVFAQTFTDYEVVIVNDGSPDTDELECALAAYRDRLHYIKQENRGASAARNAGLRAACGDLIAFLDADDLWLPNYLEEQIKFIRERGVDFVCADAVVFSDGSTDDETYMETLMQDAPSIGTVSFAGLLSAEQSLITSGVVARRRLILDAGSFDEALRNAQDYDLWLRLARSGARMAYQRRALLRYRRHNDSLSGSAVNIHRRELIVFDKIEKSYNLTAAERAEILPTIRKRRSLLEFELGKLHLAGGDFAAARQCFAKANELKKSWKTQLAFSLSNFAPGLMKAIYLRHLGSVYAK